MSASTHSTRHGEEDLLLSFTAVIAAINFEALPDFVASIRQERALKSPILDTTASALSSADRSKCTVSSRPLFGSYNILYPIEFVDGIRWLLKVPAVGYRGRWTELDARAITSEALTMQLIKTKTTIPVPEVFSFQSTIDNELNCPFIIMEFIEGLSLHDFWFDDSHSPNEIEQRRTDILGQIAPAILQLNQFRFSQGGSILFDTTGNPGIGPMIYVDEQAILDRLESDNEDETTLKSEMGPFKSQQEFFTCALDKLRPSPDKFSRGFHKLLRLFLEWIPYTDDAKTPPFVLKHPDFDIQNIIVSPEGELRGIIDWDGVAAVPCCIGNEAYPSWLTRDWDPMMYGYKPPAPEVPDSEVEDFSHLTIGDDAEHDTSCDPEIKSRDPKGHGSTAHYLPENKDSQNDEHRDNTAEKITKEVDQLKPPPIVKENSPEELSRYREIYQGFIAALVTEAYEKASKEEKERIGVLPPETRVQITRNSLMIENLFIAATNPMCQHGILQTIFDEIARVDEEKYRNLPNSEQESDRKNDDATTKACEETNCSSLDTLPVTVGISETPIDDAQESESEHARVPDSPTEYFDLGGFNIGDVALALVDGTLDAARLTRLRSGFATFCS